jgi:hypothetical protein
MSAVPRVPETVAATLIERSSCRCSLFACQRDGAGLQRTGTGMPPRQGAFLFSRNAKRGAHQREHGVRVVLGHWLLGYIHPYPDGNGRMARFLMNAMLASGGYPWTVIRVEGPGER